MKISGVLITKNTRFCIEKFLKNLKTVCDEIIVVDSGSTDGTQEIVKKYTKKLFYREFQDNFADQKNFALSKATGDWILSLDSDELLSDEAVGAIPQLTKNTEIDGYWLRRRTYISPTKFLKYGLFYPDYQLRLFRRKKEYRWEGAVHEKLTIPYGKTKEVPYDILHFPKNPKYTKWSDFRNLIPYAHIEALRLVRKDKNPISLILIGLWKFISLFTSGMVRGKGILDGWAGFRAHLLFSISIGYTYLLAGLIKSKAKKDI